MKLSISKGNTKMGKVASISHTPVAGCGKGIPCAKDCYAMKAFKMYKNVRNSWQGNLDAWNEDGLEYFAVLRAWIEKNRPRFFRFFVAGDIPDDTYLALMLETADMFPGTKFLCFTKRHDLFADPSLLRVLDTIPNLSIIASMWPCWGDPGIGLPRVWMQDGSETRIPDNAIQCIGNCETCGMCFSLRNLGRDVYFNKH